MNYVNINLQNNKEIVLDAVKQNKNALKYAKFDTQHDEDLLHYSLFEKLKKLEMLKKL